MVLNKKQPKLLVQVCVELKHENRDREINGFLEAIHFLGMEEEYIVTLNQIDMIAIGNKIIYVKPFYEMNFKSKIQ